jgi:hypothetical protein
MDFSNVEAPLISGESTNEVVDVNLPKNTDFSDLIPKVEEKIVEEEKKVETKTIEEVFDKYLKDENVISLFFHNKLYVNYKDRQEIVNDEELNNNILKLMNSDYEEYKENYYVNVLNNKSLYLKKYINVDFEEIKELKDKSLIVYGLKNSGKTTFIRNLLSKLNDSKIFVFSKEKLLFKEDNIILFTDFNNIDQILNQNPDYIYINKLDELFMEYYDLFKSFKVILESKNNTKYSFKNYIDIKVEKTDQIRFVVENENKKEEDKKITKEDEEIDLLEI